MVPARMSFMVVQLEAGFYQGYEDEFWLGHSRMPVQVGYPGLAISAPTQLLVLSDDVPIRAGWQGSSTRGWGLEVFPMTGGNRYRAARGLVA